MLCMLRDDVIFKKNYRAIHDRCWSCNRYGHLAKSCKLIHFYPLKSHIINVFFFEIIFLVNYLLRIHFLFFITLFYEYFFIL